MKSGKISEGADEPAGVPLKEVKADWINVPSGGHARPWPFLDPFGYADSDRIQGRAEVQALLVRKLSTQDSRVVVVHGASGSGKSSVLNALAVPQLVRLGFAVAVEDCLKNPRVNPLDQYSRWRTFAERNETGGSAIIVDQIEELYTLVNESIRLEFINNLVAMTSSSRIIIGVRREYYSDLDGDLSRLGVELSRVHVPLLDRESATSALLVPAGHAGLAFENGIVRRILMDLELADNADSRFGHPHSRIDPPQLQIVISTLYDHMTGDPARPTVITHAAYESLGCAERILQNFLSSSLGSLGSELMPVAQIVLKRMVTQEATKKPLLQSDIEDLRRSLPPDKVESVLQRLVSGRILRTLDAELGKSPDYELGHDYLASMIATWIDSEERPLRITSDALEKQYPALIAHPDRLILERNELDGVLRDLRQESERVRDWHVIVSTRAFLVVFAASLYWNRDAEAKWLLSVFAPPSSNDSCSSEAAVLISRLANTLDVVADYDPASWLGQLELEKCIRASLEAGSCAITYWARNEACREALRTVVLEYASAFPNDRTSTRAACIAPTFGAHYPGINDLPTAHQGTAVDALRVLRHTIGDTDNVKSLLHALRRRSVEIPFGPFAYGNSATAHIQRSYRIGIIPVTVGEYRAFVDAGGYSDPAVVARYWSSPGETWLASSHERSPDSRFWLNRNFSQPDQPVVGVSYFEAQAYCKFVDGRLPTEYEWERAARGLDGRTYPWGENLEHSRCILTAEGNSPVPPLVGSYPEGASPDGLLDMSGNVWEWTSTESESPGNKILRGGSMQLNQGVGRTYSRSHREPHDRYYFRGFRVAWDA